MDELCIYGTFADLKSVKTRSVVQMVIEIPIEQAERVVSAFGFPQPGAEIAVAVARLDPEKAKAAPTPPEKPKERFADKRLSVQAGIRCSDERFQRFISSQYEQWLRDSEDSADFVRRHCTVDSRKDLDDKRLTSSRERWTALNAEYEKWAGYTAEQR